jgi:hypothetical protein
VQRPWHFGSLQKQWIDEEITMKLQVMRNAKGELVSTAERVPGARVSVEPEISEGFKVEELEAPDDYKDKLDDFYRKHSKK